MGFYYSISNTKGIFPPVGSFVYLDRFTHLYIYIGNTLEQQNMYLFIEYNFRYESAILPKDTVENFLYFLIFALRFCYKIPKAASCF